MVKLGRRRWKGSAVDNDLRRSVEKGLAAGDIDGQRRGQDGQQPSRHYMTTAGHLLNEKNEINF